VSDGYDQVSTNRVDVALRHRANVFSLIIVACAASHLAVANRAARRRSSMLRWRGCLFDMTVKEYSLISYGQRSLIKAYSGAVARAAKALVARPR